MTLDRNHNQEIPLKKLQEMNEKRISALEEANIDEEKVFDDVKKEIGSWDTVWSKNILQGKSDVRFVLEDQWTAQERSEFRRLGKICMSFNKLWDPLKKHIGEQRRNKPDLMVRSRTGNASQDEINLRADLIRTISYRSQNDLVYQTSYLSSLLMGFGAFQIDLDYLDNVSFDKIPIYRSINDVSLCGWDPSSILPHKGDGNFCNRRYLMAKDEFFATYPYIMVPTSFSAQNSIFDYQWITRDTICICDRFVKEWFPLTIYKLSNGEVITEDEWKKRESRYENMREYLDGSISGEIIFREIPMIVDKRLTQDYRIMQYRLIKDTIIEFLEWPSKYLPLIFVDGFTYYYEGRPYSKSVIHESRDAQRAYNFTQSEAVTELKNRRREQWLVTPDNIKGNELQWRNTELQQAALIANPHPSTGFMPTKMPAWDISNGIFNMAASSNKDIRETMGFSESDELQGRDISGKARRERKMESGMSFEMQVDNFHQAIEQGGRVVNDLITHLFSDGSERNMVVSRKNGQTDNIVINQSKKGQLLNKITKGDFDVEIDAGPSFAVQQEMALEFLQETLAVFPQAFPLVADLWAKNLDVQFREQIANRFKTLVPANIIAEEEGKPIPPPQPDPQQMMMQQEMKDREMALQERQENLQLNKEKHEIEKAQLMLKIRELENKMSLEQQKSSTEIYKTNVNHDVELKKIMADLHKSHIKHSKREI